MVIMILLIVIVGVFTVLSTILPKVPMENKLKNLSSELEEIPAVVVYENIYLNNVKTNLFSTLKTQNNDYKLLEVFAKIGADFYFAYQDSEPNSTQWRIASVNQNGENFSLLCSISFCNEPGADEYYQRNFNADFSVRNGFYYNGKIILTDHVKLIEYTISSQSYNQYSYDEYKFPLNDIKSRIIDNETIEFNVNNNIQTLILSEAAKSNDNINKIYLLKSKKTWDATPCLNHFFDTVQIVENDIYIIGRILNYGGETYAIVLKYNIKTNSCHYANSYYVGDIIDDDCYVIHTE